eukprot:jgi/Ulvmu1/7988/UM004_0223.1
MTLSASKTRDSLYWSAPSGPRRSIEEWQQRNIATQIARIEETQCMIRAETCATKDIEIEIGGNSARSRSPPDA